MKKNINLIALMTLLIINLNTVSHALEGVQNVFVSILPQEYFVKRIGGDRVSVTTLVRPGNSPATYQPTSQQLAKLSEAKLYFRIGVAFENGFIPKISHINPDMRIIDTRKGVELRTMAAHHHEEDHDTEDHDADHHDDDNSDTDQHTGKDPHIWLNPLNVKIQAQTIKDALISVDPEGEGYYEKNYTEFCDDLDKLNEYITERLRPIRGRVLMVFHPAWGYFADQYGLQQQAIEVEGKSPSARQLAEIILKAKHEGVKVIFVQSQFSTASAVSVADAIGGVVVPVNPLSVDYIENLRAIADKIAVDLATQQ